MKKIKSVNKIKQGLDGNLYFVSREIIKFNQTPTGYVAIYAEMLFDIVKDENNNDVEQIIEEYPQVPSSFSFAQVNGLFSMINKSILPSEEFTNKFDELQVEAMIYDTINQTPLGRYGTKEWEKYEA